jgi:G:T-mismatch repair DNA endonuclease (very short patch repair protein)
MGRPLTEAHKRNISKALRGRPLSPEHRKKIGMANCGKKRTPEMNKANRQLRLGSRHTAESKAKMSASRKGERCGAADFWDGLSLSERRTLTKPARKALARKYEDSVFFDEQTRKILRAVNQRPNKLEAAFGKLLDDLFPGEYQYVGGGQLILCGKCPDFANVNGQKKLIEVFGDYWHRGQDPAWRIALFARLGFQTLVVWESELANEPEMVVARLQEFHEQ